MARPKASRTNQGPPESRPAAGPWTKLTWDDLERWAGGGTVQRGRSYQTGGRVQNLKVSPRGDLLATVAGTERYATTVKLDAARPTPGLESSCTCFVGMNCKHAVATVAEYLDAVAAGRDVPVASEADPRWASLSGVGDEVGADWNEADEDDDDPPPAAVRRQPATGPTSWDARIEQHLRAKSHAELADLVWSLTRRFPEVYQEFRERIALQTGDADRLIAEARRAIREATAQPGWGNAWTNEGHTPAYESVRHRFERLLEFGHADAVVQLGRDLPPARVRASEPVERRGGDARRLRRVAPGRLHRRQPVELAPVQTAPRRDQRLAGGSIRLDQRGGEHRPRRPVDGR